MKKYKLHLGRFGDYYWRDWFIFDINRGGYVFHRVNGPAEEWRTGTRGVRRYCLYGIEYEEAPYETGD